MRRRMQNEENQLRVTDRRRVYLDDQGSEHVNTEVEQPNLKPSYVEELEARTKAAERQVQEVQSRFDQLRQQLQRETDETRQRLNRSADERATAEKAKFIAALLPVMDEAVDTEITGGDMDGKVIAEYSRGFRMGDRLLRPARVKVGRAAEQAR